ncbi:MAG: tetratricopeptide repeat protein, partial [Candidatus Omnitrophica bacterium]|nr:tetratricopeptide repeat protein [Candidatus Omnitrophota bacterium]
PVLKAPFMFDDYEFIVNNPLARDAAALFSQWNAAGLKFLTYITFVGNFVTGGQDPFGYHLVNIILHICNAWLLSVLALRILKTPQTEKHFKPSEKKIIPLIAALFFLCHPVATSAVSYVWQRAELLTTIFYLAALIFYITARQDKKAFYYIAAAACFIVGIFAKGTIISLPLVVILLECALWPVSRKKAYAIILSIGAVFFFNAYMVIWEEPWGIYSDRIMNPLMQLSGMLMTPAYVWTQLFVTVKYLGLALFPIGQNFDYDIPLARGFFEARMFFSAAILAGLIACALMLWNKRRLLSVGIFWFLLCLVPAAVLGGREPMWEYRMYLPLAGLMLGIVATVFQVFPSRKTVWALCAVVAVFAGLAFARNLLWRSPEHLLLDNIRKSPQKPNPYQLLGAFYLTQGRVNEAETTLEKTIALAPDAAESYNNLALIAKNRGDILKARDMFEAAIRLRPTLTSAYINLAYLTLGQGDDAKAEDLLRQSLRVQETEGAYAALGKVSLTRGKWDEAEIFLNKSLSINPGASQAYFWFGELWAARQDQQKARLMFQQAVKLNPRLVNLVPEEFR